MSNDNKKEEKNEFVNELSEIKERQDNQYNPGHYIGTGRVPKPISNLSKYPEILIVIGVLGLAVGILFILTQPFDIVMVIANITGILVPLLVLYGGLIRLKSKYNKSSKKK